jgi:hypothetical protein
VAICPNMLKLQQKSTRIRAIFFMSNKVKSDKLSL